MWNYILNISLCEYWIVLMQLDCIWKKFLKIRIIFHERMEDFFCKTYKLFPRAFLTWSMSISFFTSCGTDFIIFAIAGESSSMIIDDMQAFLMDPETNMSTRNRILFSLNYLPNSSYSHAPSPDLLLYSLHTACS